MIAQIFIPIAEFVMPIRTETSKVHVEIETQVVIVEAKISKCST